MVMDSVGPESDDVVRRARAEVFGLQRMQLGPTEVIGDLVVAAVIPIVLWHDIPSVPLVAWGVLVAMSAILWEVVDWALADRRHGANALHNAMGWFATVVWGALPWLAPSALDDRGVRWILVFVVVIAIAADTLFVTQTSVISIDEMVVAYTLSYVVAFALHGGWVAIVATLVAYASFVIGGTGLGKVTGELIEKREQSEKMAREDDLTGLGTRKAAMDAIAAIRKRGAAELRCAFIDIDDFKQLNDNYGYQVGDLALRAVGDMLVERFPPSWVVCRFGGDEFVAVGDTEAYLPAVVDVRISLPSHGGLVLAQPLSVGMTVLPAAQATADRLFREAAAALRMAKRLGKHQVVEMTDELRASESEIVRLGSRAGAALENREIVPWAQPIVDLRSGRSAGFELLARWPQADGSMVMPNQFVPVIEDQGRGPALGMLMIEHAVEALSGPQLREGSAFVSVNLSARHLFHRRLPTEIRELLEASGVAAERLVVEITESQHLQPSPVWRETARALRRLGVGLAIDDFGTGYSSLEQLLSMPFSHLKVDQVITQAIDRPGGSDLAAAIVSMANGARMTAVAEGIETEEQRAAMLAAGYMFGQGYLFARPAPLADVLDAHAASTSEPGTDSSTSSAVTQLEIQV